MKKELLNYYMEIALTEAKKAYNLDEVPIGSIIVFNNKIIGKGHNLTEYTKDASMHAEMIALKQAAKHIDNWRLNNAYLFSTVEPCIMCAFASVLFRIHTIVFGSYDKKFGACGSIINISTLKNINHKINIIPNILTDETSYLIKEFFKNKRN